MLWVLVWFCRALPPALGNGPDQFPDFLRFLSSRITGMATRATRRIVLIIVSCVGWFVDKVFGERNMERVEAFKPVTRRAAR